MPRNSILSGRSTPRRNQKWFNFSFTDFNTQKLKGFVVVDDLLNYEYTWLRRLLIVIDRS